MGERGATAQRGATLDASMHRRTTQHRQCSFRISQVVWSSPVRIPSGRKIGRVAPSPSGEGEGDETGQMRTNLHRAVSQAVPMA